MMQRIGILFFIVLCPLFGLGQFEYFNQVIGETDDLNSEACPDIEVMNDGTYSLWGGGFQDGEERFFFRLLETKKENGVGNPDVLVVFCSHFLFSHFIILIKKRPLFLRTHHQWLSLSLGGHRC